MTDNAGEAARFLVDAYSKRRPPGDAEPYALTVARAYLSSSKRIEELEKALGGLMEALSLGPLGCAAKYGPDADVREVETAAFERARAALKDTPQKDGGTT